MHDNNKSALQRKLEPKFKIGDRVLVKGKIRFGTIDNIKEYWRLGTKDVSLVLYDVEYGNGYVERDVRESELVAEERPRWRADLDGGGYFHIATADFQYDTRVVYTEEDINYGNADKRRYDIGNYFRTQAQAEEALRRIKQTLDDYHKEIGE